MSGGNVAGASLKRKRATCPITSNGRTRPINIANMSQTMPYWYKSTLCRIPVERFRFVIVAVRPLEEVGAGHRRTRVEQRVRERGRGLKGGAD